MTVAAEMTERCVYENARVALDQNEYQSWYDGLVDCFQKLQEEHDSVTARIVGNIARKKTMEQFIGTIETQELITKFDEGLWSGLVDFVKVYSIKDIRVMFKDDTEIKA